MAAAGLVLVFLQAFVLGIGCFLCLASAAISWTLAILAWPEVSASLSLVGRGVSAGHPLRHVLDGTWARAWEGGDDPDRADDDRSPRGDADGPPATEPGPGAVGTGSPVTEPGRRPARDDSAASVTEPGRRPARDGTASMRAHDHGRSR
jgi:hypothetical protein